MAKTSEVPHPVKYITQSGDKIVPGMELPTFESWAARNAEIQGALNIVSHGLERIASLIPSEEEKEREFRNIRNNVMGRLELSLFRADRLLSKEEGFLNSISSQNSRRHDETARETCELLKIECLRIQKQYPRRNSKTIVDQAIGRVMKHLGVKQKRTILNRMKKVNFTFD